TKSLLLLPIHRGGILEEVISLAALRENVEWQHPVVHNLRVLADIIGNALLRHHSEEKLGSSERLKDSILESMGTRVVVLDNQGKIIASNHCWHDYLRTRGWDPHAAAKSGSYYELADLLREFGGLTGLAIEGIRAVSDGQRDRFELEYQLGFYDD